MRHLFFINPAAGKGKIQESVINDIKSYFSKNGGEYEIIMTEYQGHAEELSRKFAKSGENLKIFACGGEGTGYEVINGIVGFDNVSYGIIPCGSANDFVRGLGKTECFRDIAAQIEGEAYEIDLIKANDRYCINSCSVGMDAMVARDMKLFKNLPLVTGPLAYNLAIVKTLLKKLGVKINLTVDDTSFGEVSCLFAVIANGPYYGGGYMGAPDAFPFDQKLEFTKVDVISKLKILKFISKYKKGLHGDLPYCRLQSCSEMTFKSQKPLPVNLDGEIVICDAMKFEIAKKALKFIVPKEIALKNRLNLLKNCDEKAAKI